MGGKQKQSQRTKNNAKPSSSGRSAELLNSAFKLESGEAASGGKVFPAIFPTLAAVNFDQGLNPEIAVCIKKLNKKDPITKIKALQELCDVVKKVTIDEVEAMLPSWTHFYKILTVDVDRKVRECTQLCHGAVVSALGRRAARSLRSWAPAWLAARHDDHAPAAAAAQHACPFPEHKLPEVMAFCKEEVMAALAETLTANLDNKLAKKIPDPSERRVQVQRLQAAALCGARGLAESLAPAHRAWLQDSLAPLLQHHAFWKLANTDNPQLRASWCGAASACCAVVATREGAGAGGGALVARLLRALLAPPPPSAAPAPAALSAPAAAALLHIMHAVPDWHTHLENEQLLSKRIIEVLETGGWGDARALQNLLLPLLAALPPALVNLQFYSAFFTAAFKGLEKKSVMSSKMERQTWIASIAECLRYMCTLEPGWVAGAAGAALRAWGAAAVGAGLARPSAEHMAALLRGWLLQRGGRPQQLARAFWLSFADNLRAQPPAPAAVDAQTTFLAALRGAVLAAPPAPARISFEDAPAPPPPAPPAPPTLPAAPLASFLRSLHALASSLAARHLQLALAGDHALLPPLINMLQQFDSEEVWSGVATECGCADPWSLYSGAVQPALRSDRRSRPLLHVALMAARYMTDEQQQMMFDSFSTFAPSVVEWCISWCLSPPGPAPAPAPAAAERWLRSPLVRDTLIAVCRRLLETGDGAAGDLLQDCLRHKGSDGEYSISDESVSRIVSLVRDALRKLQHEKPAEEEGAAEDAGAAVEEAAGAAAGAGAALRALCRAARGAQLLTDVFDLLTATQNPELSDSLSSIWRAACATLSPDQRHTLVQHIATHLQQHVLNSVDSLHDASIEYVTSLCADVFPSLPQSSDEVVRLSQLVLQLPDDYNSVIQYYAARRDVIAGHLSCPLEDDDVIKKIVAEAGDTRPGELATPQIVTFANSVLLRATMLARVLTSGTGDAAEEECERDGTCDVLLRDSYWEQQLGAVLYDLAMVRPLREGYAFHEGYSAIERLYDKLSSLVDGVVAVAGDEARAAVAAGLAARGAGAGYYWAGAAAEWRARAGAGGAGDEEDAPAPDELTGNGYFHTMQARCRASPPAHAPLLRCKFQLSLRALLAALPPDPQLAADAVSCQRHCDIDVFVNTYYRHRDLMLFDMDMSSSPWSKVVYNAAVCDLLATIIEPRDDHESQAGSVTAGSATAGSVTAGSATSGSATSAAGAMTSHGWDFLAITLCSLLDSLYKSREHLGCTKVSLLCRAVLRLFCSSARFLDSQFTTSSVRQEWDDVFAPSVHTHLYNLITYVLAAPAPAAAPLSWSLSSLVRGARRCLVPRGAGAPLARLAGTVLSDSSSSPLHKLLAHTILHAAYGEFAVHDEEQLTKYSTEEGDQEALSVQLLLPSLTKALDDESKVTPHDESGATSALGAMLLCEAALSLVAGARHDRAIHLLPALREDGCAMRIIDAAIRWLPPRAWAALGGGGGGGGAARGALPPHYLTLFLNDPQIDPEDRCGARLVSRLACRVLVRGAGACGGAAAAWRSNAGRDAGRALTDLVAQCVAPALVRHQLDAAARTNIDDAQIRVHYSTREAILTCSVDDKPMTLTVTFHETHPLAPPEVHSDCGIAPPPRSLPAYLAHHNGSLARGLRLWASSVRARVAAVAACYVCYSRVCGGKLPAAKCHQCNNCYHTVCLRKWFATSNRSTCPLCRSAF